MDQYLILRGTQAQVQHDLYIINQIAAVWWASQGYTVIDTPEGKAIVGKNAATGEDNPDALTTTWAMPSPLDYTIDEETGAVIPTEGTLWFIPSPTSDPRFYLWRDYLPDGVTIQCEEVEMPQEWIINGE